MSDTGDLRVGDIVRWGGPWASWLWSGPPPGPGFVVDARHASRVLVMFPGWEGGHNGLADSVGNLGKSGFWCDNVNLELVEKVSKREGE